MPNCTIIAITGASASGKTLFADTLVNELTQELGADMISFIPEDAYYRDLSHLPFEQRELQNYDHPDAFDHHLMATQLQQLVQGEVIQRPTYCYKTHTRAQKTAIITPTPIILVEGILLLSDEKLREVFDVSVFMDSPLDICLLRRIQRDIEERGRSIESIRHQYIHTVRPMYYQFIEPSKQFADLIITRGGKNRIAIDLLKAKITQTIQSQH